jgi:hypothetical protein
MNQKVQTEECQSNKPELHSVQACIEQPVTMAPMTRYLKNK